MSVHEPRQRMGDEFVSAHIREAGRKVLHGALSVILAASLMSAAPARGYATESQLRQRQGRQSQVRAQQIDARQQPPTQMQNQQQPARLPSQNDAAPSGGQSDRNGSGEAKKHETGSGTDPSACAGNKVEPDARECDGEPSAQGSPSLSATVEPGTSERVNGQVYVSQDGGLLVKVTIAHPDALLRVGRATLGCKQVNANGSTTDRVVDAAEGELAMEEGATSACLSFDVGSLGAGTYRDFWVTVGEVVFADGQEAALQGVRVESLDGQTVRVVDTLAPQMVCVSFKSGEGASCLDVDLSTTDPPGSPIYVNARDASSIVATVEDDALSTEASTFQAFNQDGELVGEAAFVVGEDVNEDGRRTYTATLGGVLGKVALKIVTKGLAGGECQTKVVGGVERDGVVTADGTLVVDDENGPSIGDFVYGESVIYAESEAVAHRVLRLGEEDDGKVEVRVPITDESFAEDGVTFLVARDGAEATEVRPTRWDVDASSSNTHVALLELLAEGDYEVRVAAADALGNSTTKTADSSKDCARTESLVVVRQPVVTRVATKTTTWNDEGLKDDKTTSTAYLDHEPTFEMAFVGRHIDFAQTTILDVPLSSIPKDGGVVGGYTFSGLQHDEGGNAYSIEITLPEGSYRFGRGESPHPMVVVKDWYSAAQPAASPVVNGFFQPFVVDKTAPKVTFGVNASYANLNDLGVTPNKVLFFNKKKNEGGKDTQLVYAIADEASPIAEVRTVAPNGSEQAVYNKDFELENVPGRQFEAAVTLQEQAFTNAVLLHVKDAAGNESIWTLDDATLYPGTNRQVESPVELVEDHVAPVLAFATAPKTYDHDAYSNASVSVPLYITERNVSYLQEFFPTIRPVSVTRNGEDVTNRFSFPIGKPSQPNGLVCKDDLVWQLPVAIPAKSDHSNDGDYVLTARLQDLAGNEGEQVSTAFTVDTVAPELTVEYEDRGLRQTANGRDHFDEARVATVTVVERNFDERDFHVAATLANGAAGTAAPEHSAWTHEGSRHTCTVTFDKDGEYTLAAYGKDKAGNETVLKEGGALTTKRRYESLRPFVVDLEDPVVADVAGGGDGAPTDLLVALPSPTGQYAGVNYYAHGIQVDARVRDRNFDPAASLVYRERNGAETRQDVLWNLESGRNEDGYEVYQTAVTYAEDGEYKTPHVRCATDLSRRTSENVPKDFVIDLAAPNVEVTLDRTPASVGDGNEQHDPIQFFNQTLSMTFAMHDDHMLRCYELFDPEGEYTLARSTAGVEGKEDATLTIQLKDGANSQGNTEYERNITFAVEDLAGNRRIWTIDRAGRVVLDKTESGVPNSPINGDGIFPVALIQDTTPPVVSLDGVVAGAYYNSTQVVRAVVNELNFNYLKRFDPSRALVTVTKRQGDASHAQSSWTIPASSFEGERPVFAYDQAFEADGHYELSAEFTDYANNTSNRATIGEFTIDKTAPVVSVAWNDPAGSAPYYRETRVATITVVEHNFDPALFSVSTTGSMSDWSSDGDTHVRTVTFDADGRHALAVSGRDRAGNEATAYNEPEFTIDKTPPIITFGGTVQRYGVDRGPDANTNEYSGSIADDGQTPSEQTATETLQDHHAYNGVVMPSIEYADQAGNGLTNYEPSTVWYTLTAGRHGKRTEKVDVVTRSNATGGEVYQFADFGLIVRGEEGERNVYDPDADDVYTLTAKMLDKAGNGAEGTVTFSVNRYGSNFVVAAYSKDGTAIEGSTGINGIDYHLLGEAPTIEVREINVSGSARADDHSVLKEYANAVRPIEAVGQNDTGKSGYVLKSNEGVDSAATYGWSEYRYTIRGGNFGKGSDSDTGDGGQGVYRVNVASVDRASNDTSTSEFVDGEASRQDGDSTPLLSGEDVAGMLRNATANFTLDELSPVIDELNVPSPLCFGASCEVVVHVSDAITNGDTVRVFLDGRELEKGEFTQHGSDDGTGTYKFVVGASALPFVTHEVEVIASDGIESHGSAEARSGHFMVGMLLPEIALLALVACGIAGGVTLCKRRVAAKEPSEPMSSR